MRALACTVSLMELAWPTEFVAGGSPAAPWAAQGGAHGAATLVMYFNLECPGCVSRGIPFIKRVAAESEGRVRTMLVHTAYGHRTLDREQVVPTLLRFVTDYARVGMPVALDLTGELARAWGVEGTPHWFVFDGAGRLRRSLFGSQDNARTRLEYLLEELTGGSADAPTGDDGY